MDYAIDLGYRSIDTAYVYGNEAEIGETLTKKIKEGKIKREDIFITTKVWDTRREKFINPDMKIYCIRFLQRDLSHALVFYQQTTVEHQIKTK